MPLEHYIMYGDGMTFACGSNYHTKGKEYNEGYDHNPLPGKCLKVPLCEGLF